MVSEGYVFLHLIEFEQVDERERVLLALDDLGLQRRIDLVDIDAGRRGAERFEHGGPKRAHRHADLESFDVVGRIDRMSAAGDLPVAIIPHVVEGMEARLRDGATHEGAERAVHGWPHLAIVLECEADAIYRGHRHIGCEDQPGEIEYLDGAGAQLRQHVGVAAELAVGKELDLHSTARLFLNLVDCFAQPNVHGVGDYVVVCITVDELSGIAAPSQNTE